jgi:hypothetical protein
LANIGTRVELTPAEHAVARRIAIARHDQNRKSHVPNARISDQSDHELDLNGFAAELAFCKLFNTYPDFTIEPRSAAKGDDTGDTTLGSLSVDVKATPYRNGRLIATRWKQDGADLYALMVGECPRFEFRGFITKEALLREDRLKSLGHGLTYLAEQSELTA